MTFRKETIGDCELYLGDCRDVLPTLGKVDCVVCDPPYLLVSGGNTTGEMKGCFAKDKYDNSGAIVPCDISWPEIMQIIATALGTGDAYVMANNRNVGEMLESAKAAGLDFHNLLIWNKVSTTPNRWYMKNCEFIGYFYKGRAKAINDCSAKQLIRCPQVDVSDHPTEKPAALMEHYIVNSTQPGQIVFDPFMGSGTTGVSAVKTGRRFIGIEREEKYFDLSCQRIESANCQPLDMFARPEKIRQGAFV